MKRTYLIIILTFFFSIAFSQDLQIWKYRVNYTSIREFKNGKWSEWVDSKNDRLTEALVVLDLIHKKVNIYPLTDNTPLDFAITFIYPVKEDEDGSFFKFDAIDFKNRKTKFYLNFFKGKTKTPVLDIEFSDNVEMLLFLKSDN